MGNIVIIGEIFILLFLIHILIEFIQFFYSFIF